MASLRLIAVPDPTPQQQRASGGLSSGLHVFTGCMWDWFILKYLRRSSQNHLFISITSISSTDTKWCKYFWWCRFPGFKYLSLRNTLTRLILIRSHGKYKKTFISVYFDRFIFKHYVGMKNNTICDQPQQNQPQVAAEAFWVIYRYTKISNDV